MLSAGDVFAAQEKGPQTGLLLFTVFTATYNRVKLLPRVYESLCAQSCRDFEWLIVDDGSTDDTRAWVERCQKIAPFTVRYAWQPNSHKKVALNHGVRLAQGELLVVLDSDDTMRSDALTTMQRLWLDIPVEQRSSFSAVTGLCERPDGAIVGQKYPRDMMDSTPMEMILRYQVRGEKFGFQRVDVMRQYPFPEDVDGYLPESIIWWRIAKSGYQTRFVNVVLRTYYDSPDSISRADEKPVSSDASIQGLRALAHDTLTNHLNWFWVRPSAFILAAARHTRFTLRVEQAQLKPTAASLLKTRDSTVTAATDLYRVTKPLAIMLIWLTYPIGWLAYRRDVSRGHA
jgi:hypothetical protein